MTAEASQQPVIDFLSDPASHGGAPVKRIDTHAASVFLAGGRAFKIKRAVRFPFLDFSTLEKRKDACEAEISVNRAFAPSIYRSVVPITREPNGRLAFSGKGEPIEWAVEMRRFDETQTLDNLVETGRIDDALADALGRAVAAAHRVAPTVVDANFVGALAEIIAQNEAELAAEPDLFSLQELRALAAATRDAFERVKPLLQWHASAPGWCGAATVICIWVTLCSLTVSRCYSTPSNSMTELPPATSFTISPFCSWT